MITRRLKKMLIVFLGLLLLSATAVIAANFWIESRAKAFVTDDIELLKTNKVGLVLGTTKTVFGYPNPYFYNRINSAAALYRRGKIKYLVVSGDNSLKEYNEPRDMKEALVELGIPEKRIYLDYAGFRTLDSVVRCKEIFGQESFTVISQRFHNERAVYIARKFGIEAVGFNAADLDSSAGFRTRVREYFARFKVFIDLMLGVKPKFLGERINVV